MAQPATFLLDSVNPTEQVWAWAQPIYWTSSRTYAFTQQIPVSTNKSCFYKSLDGGITWTTPDFTHAVVCHGFADFFFDGVSNIVNILMFVNSSGSQSLVLQNFDLNAETYSATYGAAGAPTDTFVGPVRISRTADGHLICFYQKDVGGANSRLRCAIYDTVGNTWGAVFDPADNLPPGGLTLLESIIPDPSNNLVHLFYSNGISWCYRQIASNGTAGAVTVFSSGWNIQFGNLNQGRAFGTGYLNAGVLTIPVLTRDPGTAIFSLNVITGTPSSGPAFSISAPIQTAVNDLEGWEPAQAIAYQVGAVQYVLYFTGDGLGNLYNLVRLATNSGSGWSALTIYNALNDPNAGQNTRTLQWLNAISVGPDPLGQAQFQVATWLTLAGQSFQNTAELSTRFSGVSSLALACGSPPAGQLGQNYSAGLVPSGGVAPYTFAIIAGALPTGLSLNAATGAITGSPSALGLFTFTAQVTDSSANTASVVCSISINPMLPPREGGGGIGCYPICIDPCIRPDEVKRFARVLARGALILLAGSRR